MCGYRSKDRRRKTPASPLQALRLRLRHWSRARSMPPLLRVPPRLLIASSRSENGRVSLPMIWPVSCPLPAMTRASPAPKRSHAGTDSAVAIADLFARFGQLAGGISLRICADDFSLREIVVGDDHIVGELSQPRRAINGRLPLSRSPPQPKTTRSLPATCGRIATSTVSSASGVCAHNRHRSAHHWLRSRDALQAARRALDLFARAVEERASHHRPRPMARPAATRALESLKTSGEWQIRS